MKNGKFEIPRRKLYIITNKKKDIIGNETETRIILNQKAMQNYLKNHIGYEFNIKPIIATNTSAKWLLDFVNKYWENYKCKTK